MSSCIARKVMKMEIDKSIALQKQVRDNADTLRNEFVDMKNWEQQMKKADMELRGSVVDHTQSLPPIRRKKTSSRSKSKSKDNGSKCKRIKSYDYSAWDNFDADKACEEIDKENESEDSGEELLSKEELEKNHEEATKHKVMGNTYVKQQKWDKAMACYSEAIKVFPYDAVFWANRALCHLKMDNLYSAESDCTSAIQRDEHYVKAYHRRATARMALKQYVEAVEDLEKLLSLEGHNKEAKKMLAAAQKALQTSKPVILNTTKTQETVSKSEKDEKPTITLKIVDVHKTEVSDEKFLDKKYLITDQGTSKGGDGRTKNYPWLPDVGDDVQEIEVINKLPHQRSKKPLRSVPIVTSNLSQLSMNSTDPSPVKPQAENHLEMNSSGDSHGKASEVFSVEKLVLPPVPRTAVQFAMNWSKNKSPEFRYKYLKQIPAESIPKVFQDSMESSTFSEILKILSTQFVPHKDSVFQYLSHLTEIKRFRMLTMFMSKTEKEDLEGLFTYCRATESRQEDEMDTLRSKYEL
ncbi:RNA polymerase II-associated protein 3 [Fopius arisanus]|uniref:RNA polymerase II-associated protein 3 n=2 Tax=Fopius arisanus TaxID=64838 RepID=A0A9R1ST63_9HYME|nr:PREDICTED: RNA polymerase II-associated protein 3 [Fopius arisanus]